MKNKTIFKIIVLFITVFLFNSMGYVLKYFYVKKEQNYFLNAFSQITQIKEILNGEILYTIFGVLFFVFF